MRITAGESGGGAAIAAPAAGWADVDAEERDAVLRCQKGERDAFELLVRRYMRRASAFALGWTGSREDALDVSQEAFVRAYRAIGGFDPARPFYPWFHQILRNLCLTRLGRLSRLNEVPLDDRLERPGHPVDAGTLAGGRAFEDRSLDPQAALERNELRAAVWSALRGLPANDREILVLREFLDLTYAEIAVVLDIPQGTVMSRLHTARGRLRERLEPTIDTAGGGRKATAAQAADHGPAVPGEVRT